MSPKKNLKILDLLKMLGKKSEKLRFDGDLPWYNPQKIAKQTKTRNVFH